MARRSRRSWKVLNQCPPSPHRAGRPTRLLTPGLSADSWVRRPPNASPSQSSARWRPARTGLRLRRLNQMLDPAAAATGADARHHRSRRRQCMQCAGRMSWNESWTSPGIGHERFSSRCGRRGILDPIAVTDRFLSSPFPRLADLFGSDRRIRPAIFYMSSIRRRGGERAAIPARQRA